MAWEVLAPQQQDQWGTGEPVGQVQVESVQETEAGPYLEHTVGGGLSILLTVVLSFSVWCIYSYYLLYLWVT